MIIVVSFPIKKGVWRNFEIDVDLRKCCDEKTRQGFISCLVDQVIEKLALDYCRAMGRGGERECVEMYVVNQGEAMRSNIEAAVKMWLVKMAEVLKECGRNRACIMTRV